jgi:hypothetical protein
MVAAAGRLLTGFGVNLCSLRFGRVKLIGQHPDG